ncbi:MAG: hypothetical protein KDC24_00735 [Saprospiraceae bacterium]|nr:hypothetical protein [Saprospiraceae bacterium]
MEEKKRIADYQTEDDPNYIGNMWGWKLSYISLAIILFFIAWMAYLHWSNGTVPSGYNPDQVKQDSTEISKETNNGHD